MKRLLALFDKPARTAIGLMSGTSVDGVSVVLACLTGSGIGTSIQQLAFATYPFTDDVRRLILENSAPGQGTVDQICRLNFLLGDLYVDAIEALLKEAGMAARDIDFVGSHGQTLHHLPSPYAVAGKSVRSTLQIGEPSVIANRLGILTVGDFRVADVAVGGEGAPLVPYFDFIILRSEKVSRGLLNLGGIGNITVLPKGCRQDQVFAFDTGPANMVIDQLMQRSYQRKFDEGGEVAGRGNVRPEILERLVQHPYLHRRPPKSTGREMFGAAFVDELIGLAGTMSLTPEDLLATVTEFSAYCIGESYRRFIESETALDELLVSGGGVKNRTLMTAIQRQLPNITVQPCSHAGIDPHAKEALCFAVLANEMLAGHAANLPRVTGARRPVLLGKICLPPNDL
ncbi:MAG: anhydro-N-acetylmuramic acid kinase [Acidobacteria bacterium]|nr:anhydro-N-acetylmuramic acid kinase [Acidobacteriota bacterium]MBI3655316.1 anhydro-N-acetylmuramic acid kinase [Acidobacteriota bacterium]